MKSLQEILNYLPTASTDDLKKILKAVQSEIPKRDGAVNNHVEYVEDFCPDKELLDLVWGECESLNLDKSRNKTSSQWLSSTATPYVYTDSNPIHSPKDISSYPAIKQLLSLVNASTEVTGPLDSCLVLKYNSATCKSSRHNDDEDLIDQQKSICSFSMGCERTIEFFKHPSSKTSKAVKTIRMKNNSLVIMRPGTQQKFQHQVRAEVQNKKQTEGTNPGSQVRYSLSFRAVCQSSPPSSVQTTSSPTPQSQTEHVTVVAGDSFATRLDADKLGKGKKKIRNIAAGGAKMDQVQKQLEQFAATNTGVVVDKVIISVGTNDIRNCKDLNLLRGPLKVLSSKVSELYPHSKVFFQSLLPLPLNGDNDYLTNRRVQDFNRMLFNECKFRHFYFIDVFYPFTKFRRARREPIKRFDHLFEVNGIHPNKERGLGVLARYYIRAIHSQYFNPYVYQ